MDITYRRLTPEQYSQRIRTVIAESESLHKHVQDVGDGKATIGWGLTLNRNDNVAIWRAAGVALSDADWRLLQRVDGAPRDAKTALGLGLAKRLTEPEADRLLVASLGEYEQPARRLGMPLSEERVAMVSVSYNRGPGSVLRHPVMDAIRQGDRAEAWYQLRYECWGTDRPSEAGLRKRRFAEAQIFGLYDDPGRVSPQEAGRVYDMYRRHRPEIERVERGFGVTVDGIEARRNRIAQANRDYPGIVAQYGELQTISASLAPARHALLRQWRADHPQAAAELTEHAFNAGRLDPRLLDARPRARREDSGASTGDDSALQDKLREQVRSLDQGAGKPWDDASERLFASAHLLAKENGFTARDELKLAFNQATDQMAAGEVLHLVRAGAGASPDPAANRVHMAVADALAMPAEQRLQLAERAGHEHVRQQAERDARVPEQKVQGQEPHMVRT